MWAHGWPILACFAAFAITRHGAGAVDSGFTPLAVLPVVGAGLYGRRRDVIFALLAGTAAFAVPPLLSPQVYPPSTELRRALLWLVADALVAVTIHRLVTSHRRHINNLMLLARTSRDLSTATNAREAICRVTAQISSADLVYLLEPEDSTPTAAHRPPSARASAPAAARSPVQITHPDPHADEHPASTDLLATDVLPPRPHEQQHDQDSGEPTSDADSGPGSTPGRTPSVEPRGGATSSAARAWDVGRGAAAGREKVMGTPWLVSTAAVGQVRGQQAPPVRIDTTLPSLTADAFAGKRAGFIADVGAEPGVSEAIRSGLDVASATWQPVGTTTSTSSTSTSTSNGMNGQIGLLIVVWHRHRDELDPAMQAMIAALAADAAVAIERDNLLARVQQAASHDALTGLANRYHWDTTAAHEVARAARDHQPLTFALIDLDHFKRYNDTRGHLAGDHLLRGFAQQARSRLRDVDTFARWGGEEFAVAMPGCTAHDAFLVAQRLHTAVPDGQSCTIGISQWRAGETHHDALRRADQALYDGKNRQRGTTTIC